MAKLRFSALADQDIEDIYLYSVRKWGKRQAEAYVDGIKTSAESIAIFPNVGREYKTRKGLKFRWYASGRHFLFYRIERSGILIVRILHARMDFSRHLD